MKSWILIIFGRSCRLFFSCKKLFLFRKHQFFKKNERRFARNFFWPSFQIFSVLLESLSQKRNHKSSRIFYLYKDNFLLVENEWEENKWGKRQLAWICSNIESGNSLLDPTNFIEQDFFLFKSHKKLLLYRKKFIGLFLLCIF